MSAWKDEIKKDLVPFANPGTTLDCVEEGDDLAVTWKARNKKLKAVFRMCKDEITVDFEEVSMSYSSFLASSSMSDMLGIAGMILQMKRSSIFVDTKAKNPESDDDPRSALSLLNDSVHYQDQRSTHILFINADAGAGKTEVLKQLVFEQAERYVRGDVNYLYLYINAQGRALARLEEALATEIQDLRASNLTYHVVPALTRNNIIVPIIDGFDELLGVMGYEDAFSSLRRFLAELHGRGCLIASARSTYYQQEFLSRANRASSGLGGITISQIDVQPWQHEEFSDFLNQRFSQEHETVLNLEAFKAAMARIFTAERNATLSTKPFFLAAAAELILKGVTINEDNLIDQLVEGFIERERLEKLLDQHGRPLLSNEQIHNFLQMISDEMWVGEVRALDRDTVRDLADLAFDAHVIGSDVSQRLQERAATMAFFTASTHRDNVEFEHQLFFAYFLGEGISVLARANQEELFRTFVRAALPEGAASFAARRLVTSGQTAAKVIGECNGVASRGSIRPTHLRENAGALIVEFMREDSIVKSNKQYKGLVFSNVIFAGVQFPYICIKESSFLSVNFIRSDLSRVKLEKCSGDGLILQDIVVDTQYTQLEIEGLSFDANVFGLRVRQNGRVQPVFILNEVKNILVQCSFPGLNSVQSVGIEEKILLLIERLFRKFDRANVFWPTDEVNRNITHDQNWEKILEILISSGLVVQERVSSQSGVPRPHLRVTTSSEVVMLGQSRTGNVPDRVQKFWNDVRNVWPTNSDKL